MNEAHGMRLDHAIFQGPIRPTIETKEIPTPEGYRSWESDVPAKFAAWKVQDGELGTSVDYGLVSDPYGFEDSPDAEWISGGVNSKGPRSMAIGRQGNWFLWGFAGDPTQMTESGKQVFLNSIVWMKEFDGKSPLLAFAGRGAPPVGASKGLQRLPHRDNALVHVAMARAYGKEPRMGDYVRQKFPKAVWASTHGDPAALEEWTRANLEWMRPVEVTVEYENENPDGTKRKGTYQSHVLDADPILADLGVSNRKPEFFEEYERLLGERGASDATVKELADRYLPPEAPREAEAFEKWLADTKGRLFFSDVYGFRWFVAPAGAAPAATEPRSASTRGS
jgi:hypothetical protein